MPRGPTPAAPAFPAHARRSRGGFGGPPLVAGQTFFSSLLVDEPVRLREAAEDHRLGKRVSLEKRSHRRLSHRRRQLDGGAVSPRGDRREGDGAKAVDAGKGE